MKIGIIRANTIMNYLIRSIHVICQNRSKSHIFHKFLHELMDIFVYENNSQKSQKSKRVKLKKVKKRKELNKRLDTDNNYFFC